MQARFALLSLFIFAFLSGIGTLSVGESASVGLFVFFLLDLIDNFGKKIVILHFFTVLAIFQWLIMPIFSYHWFNGQNHLAVLWVKVMEVSSEEYFSFVLPATIAMIVGFKFPIKQPRFINQPIVYIQQLRLFLKGKSNYGWILFLAGLLFSSLSLAIESLSNIFFLLSTLVYAGVLYLFYSNFSNKVLVIGLLVIFEVVNSLKTGMFGGSLYLIILIVIILSLELRIRFATKLALISLGIILVILLQSVKGDYRASTWDDKGNAGVGVFTRIVEGKINNSAAFIGEENLFFLIMRFNNGWHIARTMDRVPKQYPYSEGESIAMSIAATLVPRFLWEDKPKAGGKANLERFWGESYGRTAMNISPVGEAYANFGTFGGAIFMFFFGLLLNWFVSSTIAWVERHPSIICWFPTIFYSFFGTETDIMGILNSFVKGIFFTYIFLWLFKSVFGKKL